MEGLSTLVQVLREMEMNKTMSILGIILAGLVLIIIYSIPGGHKIPVVTKQYDILCIEGLTYIAINRNLQSAMMSIMLDKESKVIPCQK